MTCDFETDYICGYEIDKTNVLQWKRYSGQNENSESGPSEGMNLKLN